MQENMMNAMLKVASTNSNSAKQKIDYSNKLLAQKDRVRLSQASSMFKRLLHLLCEVTSQL
jgi:hypothetical protein